MNTEKESNVLRIVKEDFLEVLGREKNKVLLKSMNLELKVSSFFVSKVIKELEKENLIKTSIKKGKRYVQLTEEGKDKAREIIKKHLVLERYFRKTRSKKEAIKRTNILEHYISMEVIDNIKKLSTFKEKGVPLTEFGQKEGLITDIIFGIGLFERIISMGISPGEKIKIINEIPNGIVIEVKNKKFVLAKKIARGIKVLKI